MRFLLIEDQKNVRDLMAAFLADLGNCDMAEDGLEGLEFFQKSLARETPYDAIFLDIMMPKLEGQEVLQKIRRLEEEQEIMPPASTRVIMSSALGDSENVMEAFKSQADAYLVKPVMREKLMDTLQKAGLKLPDSSRR